MRLLIEKHPNILEEDPTKMMELTNECDLLKTLNQWAVISLDKYKKQIEDAKIAQTNAEKERDEIKDVLKNYQYMEDGTCPCCGLWEAKGHREKCEIGKALNIFLL